MRIISGESKGRKIKSPKGRVIRPTLDRVREAIFDIIGNRVVGATILDLFAGTGSFGLEALSRGAKRVTFCEKARAIRVILEENISSLGYNDKCNIIKGDALKIKTKDRYDVIFADPPYEKNLIYKVLKIYRNKAKLLIIEHSKREKVEEGTSRRFGDTIITFIEENKKLDL
jgi:16S rRNA (guanine966-N2)-methyltransferase